MASLVYMEKMARQRERGREINVGIPKFNE